MNPMLNMAKQAAFSAGKIMIRFADHLDSIQVKSKGYNDLVTQVDQMVEHEIIAILKSAYPGHSFLAEESGQKEGNDYCWIIDPIDGTTNFIHGLPQFATSIALKKNDELIVGVVFDPIKNELFTAAKGQGANLNNRRIRVSDTKKLDSALIGTGFPVKNKELLPDYLKHFQTVIENSIGIRRAGAASLDLAYVACGRLDGFWEASLNEWDMAAGRLLIQEAGGSSSNYSGETTLASLSNLVAGNGAIHKALLNIVSSSD